MDLLDWFVAFLDWTIVHPDVALILCIILPFTLFFLLVPGHPRRWKGKK
jgi:hypothetical protein